MGVEYTLSGANIKDFNYFIPCIIWRSCPIVTAYNSDGNRRIIKATLNTVGDNLGSLRDIEIILNNAQNTVKIEHYKQCNIYNNGNIDVLNFETCEGFRLQGVKK